MARNCLPKPGLQCPGALTAARGPARQLEEHACPAQPSAAQRSALGDLLPADRATAASARVTQSMPTGTSPAKGLIYLLRGSAIARQNRRKVIAEGGMSPLPSPPASAG